MSSMYEILQGLPLFKGTSIDQISSFLEKTHVEFRNHHPGDVIAREGEQCGYIKYVISGAVRKTTRVCDGLALTEEILGPGSVLMPTHLFGLITSYPAHVESIEEGSLMLIRKDQYFELLNSDPIFVLNFVNYLSYHAQMRLKSLLNFRGGSLEQWLKTLRQGVLESHFVESRIHTSAQDIAHMLGMGEDDLRRQLAELRDKGAINYRVSPTRPDRSLWERRGHPSDLEIHLHSSL